MKGKRGIVVATLVAVATLSAAFALFGCAHNQPSEPATTQGNAQGSEASANAGEATTYAEWKALHPNEYGSFATNKWRDGFNHSHYAFRYNVENYTGDSVYNATCIACKTTTYNAMYDKYGEELFELPFEAVKDEIEAYYDCNLCHTDSTGTTLKAQSDYFIELAGDTFAGQDEGSLVCGQCHNALGSYRLYAAQDGMDITTLEPYRYGYDADALYQAFIEDNKNVPTDEATGSLKVGIGHPDLELYVGSNHQSLGLTCASCHMPSTSDENYQEFTSHNASGSPLENEDALEYCLTCHKGQGIETTQAMVEFVREAQDEFGVAKDAAAAKQTALKEALTSAASSGDANALEKARDNYSKGSFYLTYAVGGGTVSGSKIAHNPEGMHDLVNRASKLFEEGLALL